MQVQPASLFREVIPTIVRTDSRFYLTLPTNDKMIEKERREDGNYHMKLTSANWKRSLDGRLGTEVYIPLSCLGIHHKLIELYGHDRVLELVFYGHREMPNGQTQLTFRSKRNTIIRENWEYIACRAESLHEYPMRIYVKMSWEEINRYKNRFMIIKWRNALQSTTQYLLDAEIKKGNLHKDHASFLRSRVQRMIARTHEEHIERKRAIERVCDMGRKYAQMVRERDMPKE